MQKNNIAQKQQKQQTAGLDQTYVGKYGCQAQYYSLKDCLSEKTMAGKSVGLCDPLYDQIGECILKSFMDTDGKGLALELQSAKRP